MRLAHLPVSHLKILLPFNDIKSFVDTHICQVCPLTKKTRSMFRASSIKTTCIFQLLHVDVWGPYKVKTKSSYNQFLTIVDDFSQYNWVHLFINTNRMLLCS